MQTTHLYATLVFSTQFDTATQLHYSKIQRLTESIVHLYHSITCGGLQGRRTQSVQLLVFAQSFNELFTVTENSSKMVIATTKNSPSAQSNTTNAIEYMQLLCSPAGTETALFVRIESVKTHKQQQQVPLYNNLISCINFHSI